MTKITTDTTLEEFMEGFMAWLTKETLEAYEKAKDHNSVEVRLDWYNEYITDYIKDNLRSSIDTSKWTEDDLEDGYHYAIDYLVSSGLKNKYKVKTTEDMADIVCGLIASVVEEILDTDLSIRITSIIYKQKHEGGINCLDGFSIKINKDE